MNMRALSLLNTFQIPFGSRGLIRVTSISAGGKAIKYNKENKSLFGNLLETTSQRRKRQQNETEGAVFVDIEKPVQLKKQPKKFILPVKREKLISSKPKVSIISKKRNTPEPPEEHSPEAKDIKRCDVKTDVLPVQNTFDEQAMKHDIYSSVKNFSKGQLILPESVVHNLTTFPLINKTREFEKDERLNELIVLEKVKLYPSVSKILNATKSDGSLAALKRWRGKMIAQLGEEGFLQYYKGLLSRGSDFHSIMQTYLQGEEPIVNAEMEGCWASLQAGLLKRVGKVEAIEQQLVHPWLLYRGILDCVAVFDGEPMLIEWKKSDKQKPQLENTYDAPLQLASYLGALNFDPAMNLKVKGGVVVVVYSDGCPAEAFPLTMSECAPYWASWLTRVQLYWKQQNAPPE